MKGHLSMPQPKVQIIYKDKSRRMSFNSSERNIKEDKNEVVLKKCIQAIGKQFSTYKPFLNNLLENELLSQGPNLEQGEQESK